MATNLIEHWPENLPQEGEPAGRVGKDDHLSYDQMSSVL
jgi:hypothetical protein